MKKQSKDVMDKLMDRQPKGLSINLDPDFRKTKVYMDGQEIGVTRIDISQVAGELTRVTIECVVPGTGQQINVSGNFQVDRMKSFKIPF